MQYSGALRSKLPTTGTTIFTVMSQMAVEHNAINLAQGFPDFSVSTDLINLVSKYMKKGYNQYAPMAGSMKLREIVAQKVEDLYNTKYNPDTEITITSGATQAIYTAISAIVNEGDEVIVFEPAYDCYIPAIELNGGKAIFVQLKFPEYSINWDDVRKLINKHTRMIIINNPNNPTGSILSTEDLMNLEKLIRNTDIVVLSDEVYEHIVFDSNEHQSVARFPRLAERSFIISSFGKTYHATGWKMGYCLAPINLMNEFRKVHQFLVFSANHPVQLALAEFMARTEEYLNLGNFYSEKRNYFQSLLKNSKFELLPCNGTYFQILKYDKISQESDIKFAEILTTRYGVASIPVSVFYHRKIDNKVLRFCFAKENSTLEKAAEKLCSI
ncbi:MAG: methionine aminotransferase [Bacteroidia bacterium]|nr:methionine aminotransferase [Bacteroidia bacterium]MCZ2248405.1 methionine aminotransferase [Bacteroidia bacterium]